MPRRTLPVPRGGEPFRAEPPARERPKEAPISHEVSEEREARRELARERRARKMERDKPHVRFRDVEYEVKRGPQPGEEPWLRLDNPEIWTGNIEDDD